MKTPFLILAFFITKATYAQTYNTKDEAKAAIKGDVYTSLSGWKIKEGDTILLGKGTMNDKQFSFIYKKMGPMYDLTKENRQWKMSHTYNGKKAIVTMLEIQGTGSSGYFICAVLRVGDLNRYRMDIENAIDAGELALPPQYAKATKTDGTNSLADELKKLKDLLDTGAITQNEYDTLKKKLIDKQ